MARQKSEFLGALGKYFAISKALVDEVLALGGGDEDLSRISTDGNLRRQIAELVVKGKQAVSAAFRTIVNYDRSVALGIQAGNYGWHNDGVTDQHFPPEKGESGSKEIGFELVHLNKAVSSEQALQELANRNLRPATLRELLAFGETYPDEQRKYPIVALGSVWRHSDGLRFVPYLWDDGGRGLSLGWGGGGWGAGCRFLAVRKS